MTGRSTGSVFQEIRIPIDDVSLHHQEDFLLFDYNHLCALIPRWWWYSSLFTANFFKLEWPIKIPQQNISNQITRFVSPNRSFIAISSSANCLKFCLISQQLWNPQSSRGPPILLSTWFEVERLQWYNNISITILEETVGPGDLIRFFGNSDETVVEWSRVDKPHSQIKGRWRRQQLFEHGMQMWDKKANWFILKLCDNCCN